MKKKEIVQEIGLPKPSPSHAPLPSNDDALTSSPEGMGKDGSFPRRPHPFLGKWLFGYFLLGLFLAALELAVAIYTKLLDWPGVFIGLFFSLFFLISFGVLRRPGNGVYFFLTMVSYSVALLGTYIFQRLVLLKSPLVLWNLFYYFLLYAWPGILAALCAALLRVLLRPTPSPLLASLRRQAKLHRRVQRRAEQAGPGTARPLRLEQEMRRRAAKRKEKR